MSNLTAPDLMTPCKTVDELRAWVREHLNLQMPSRAVCKHHQSPMDYLATAYFEPARDQVVWAPRGGGKTTLAAVATLLDLIHKPGCQVRILGGSLEQSLRMWDTLLPMFQDNEQLNKLIENPRATARKLKLGNQSAAAVLTQSQRSVRGVRVQKLRCDEVEMFDESVWNAAQLVTRSCRTKQDETNVIPIEQTIQGSIEALSTLHRCDGLMQRIIDHGAARQIKIIKWCLLDVLERCPADRDCKTCPLWDECRGVAKTGCDGFFQIDDAIRMKSRVSLDIWQTEMLCQRPTTRGSVFPMLDEQLHVRADPPFDFNDCEKWLGIDFGFSAPLVCLWIAMRGEEIYVFDEHIQRQRTIQQHLEVIEARPWGRPRRIACDPAGGGPNEQTAKSNIDLLQQRGYRVIKRGSKIADGVEIIRGALKSATGQTRLTIHPRCAELLKAMRGYRYANDASELPLKDGENDHAVDALRYFFVNQTRSTARVRSY